MFWFIQMHLLRRAQKVKNVFYIVGFLGLDLFSLSKTLLFLLLRLTLNSFRAWWNPDNFWLTEGVYSFFFDHDGVICEVVWLLVQ